MGEHEMNNNVNETVKRIEKALDLRFEADTTLYISKEDTDKIKFCLANNNFQNISAMTTKLGSKVVAKVILKNSWLVDFKTIRKNTYKKKFESLFSNLKNDFFLEISESVVHDCIFSSIEFKEFIEAIYFSKVDVKYCQKNYENTNFKLNNRLICFSRYIQEDYIRNNPGSHVVRLIEQAFNKYPEIEQNVHNELIAKLTPEMSDKLSVAKWIVENKIQKNTIQIWASGLLSLGQIGFDASIKYIKEHVDNNNETCRHLIEKIFPKFFSKSEHCQYLSQEIVDLYKGYSLYRFSLLKMITPNTFFDKDVANSLLDKFEAHATISDRSTKFVSEVRGWNKDKRTGYSEVEEISSEFQKKHDVTNIKTLKYLSRQLKQTDITKVLAFYENSGQDEDKFVKILSYYFASCYSRHPPVELEAITLSSEYIDHVCHYMELERIKSPKSKLFLEKHNKFDLITKLFER